MKKRNREYWRNRFDFLEQTMNDIAQDTYLNLEKAFEKAQAKLNREIAYWVNKFADNNKISLEEAKRILNANELKEFKWAIEEYIKYGEENNLNGQWIKQLKNASARHHISRLEAMKIQTQQIIERVYDEEFSSTEGMIKNIYSQNYYRSIYEIQKAFGIGFVINEIDESKLNTIIRKPWAPDGQNFSDRIWRNKTQMVNELHQEMIRIAVTGEHPKVVIDKLAKHVDKKYRTAKRQASALVMTECAFFSSVSQGDAFKKLGVEKFEVVATLDTLTSEICQEMDGKVFPEELREPGVTCNPFHVNCRSTTCPYFDDEFTEGEMRAARNEDGTVYYVPADMKYPEWYEKFVKSKENEKSNKGKNSQTRVDKKFVKSSEYSKKFSTLEENKEVKRELKNKSIEILKHRDGTFFEDLVFVDSKTGESLVSKDYQVERTAKPTKKMEKMIKKAETETIIAIHNHPNSTLPSASDLRVAYDRKYKYGLIACHNGDVFKYKITKEPDIAFYNSVVAKCERKGYNISEFKEQLQEKGIFIEVL